MSISPLAKDDAPARTKSGYAPLDDPRVLGWGSIVLVLVVWELTARLFHDEERHRPSNYTEVSNRDDVLMTNGRGGKRLLPKSCDKHRIVSDEIRQNHFYGVGSFEKDVASFKDDAHSTLS